MKLSKKDKQLIDAFNRPDTALVVSGYPVDAKYGRNYGIAWYTKETLEPMAEKFGKRFVVLAEKNGDNKPKLYADGKVLVLRVFDQKRVHLYPQILRWLPRFSKIKQCYVHSEFGMTGKVWHFALLMPFLAMIRAFGKQITFYSHNVIADVGEIAGHVNVAVGSLMHKFLNIGLRGYYWLLARLCKKIVVLDEVLGKRLERFVSQDQIVVSQLPVAQKTLPMPKAKAKKRLGIDGSQKVIVSFGFVTWYKGADWLVKTAERLFQQEELGSIQIVLAGGASYSLRSQQYYQDYFTELNAIAGSNPQITISGFVPENEIGMYMAAADLVVLPYRGLMGASGALSHALSYGKPVVFSCEMQQVLESDDVLESMQLADICKGDLLFELDDDGFTKLQLLVKNDQRLKKLVQFSQKLREKRSLQAVVAEDMDRIYAGLGGVTSVGKQAFFPFPSYD